MNHQLVSEIIVEETVRVSSGDTARAVSGRQSTGAGRPHDFSDSIATCYLAAVAEAACIREMRRSIDPSTEIVVGRRVDIDHRQPIAPFALLRLRGWVEQVGERSARFVVRVIDARATTVCDVGITLVAVDRATLATRLADGSTVPGPPTRARRPSGETTQACVADPAAVLE